MKLKNIFFREAKKLSGRQVGVDWKRYNRQGSTLIFNILILPIQVPPVPFSQVTLIWQKGYKIEIVCFLKISWEGNPQEKEKLFLDAKSWACPDLSWVPHFFIDWFYNCWDSQIPQGSPWPMAGKYVGLRYIIKCRQQTSVVCLRPDPLDYCPLLSA